LWLNLFFCVCGARDEPRTSRMLGKCFFTGYTLCPLPIFLLRFSLSYWFIRTLYIENTNPDLPYKFLLFSLVYYLHFNILLCWNFFCQITTSVFLFLCSQLWHSFLWWLMYIYIYIYTHTHIYMLKLTHFYSFSIVSFYIHIIFLVGIYFWTYCEAGIKFFLKRR
jgi:hypothetical protein